MPAAHEPAADGQRGEQGQHIGAQPAPRHAPSPANWARRRLPLPDLDLQRRSVQAARRPPAAGFFGWRRFHQGSAWVSDSTSPPRNGA